MNKKNPEYIWKYSRKKNVKAIGAVLGYSKPKIFLDIFSRPCLPRNHFTADTVLIYSGFFRNNYKVNYRFINNT